MRNRKPIFYWLLIGVPAIILTGTAISSLFFIQNKMDELNRDFLKNLSHSLASSVALQVYQRTDDLKQTLEALPQENLTQALYEIRRTNPFVRNVFIWEKGKGIVLPSKESLSTEDQLFLGRYQGFFPPEYVWWMPTDTQDLNRKTVLRSGTKEWVDVNGLQRMVWRQAGEQCFVGIEMEMIALLAHISLLPIPDGLTENIFKEKMMGVVLMDSRGTLVRYGNVPEKSNPNTSFLIPVDNAGLSFPTWNLIVYWTAQSTDRGVEAIMLVGGALIFLLIASLFAGGFLFARDAARERKDALQKTTFVANVSHELKTPLTNVRLYAELLADGHAKTPEAQQQYLGIIVTESERLTRLINNVLDFGRLEQQRRAFHLETLTLDEWLRSTVHALQGITDDAEMTVTVSCPPGLCVRADRDALSQVFLNVIDNACKYAKGGKVIDITVDSAAGGKAALSISDRGSGLEPRHAQRIFQRFFRVDDSVTANVGGCGLGLSIARQLMQGMGGDIRWNPRDGGGSTFVLTMKTTDFPASNH